MSLFSNQFTSFGLDFTDGSLTVAEIKKNIKGPALQAWGLRPLPAGLIVNGEITDKEKLAEEIKLTLAETKGRISTRFVASALPENKTFLKFLTIKKENPKIKSEEIRKKLDEALPNYFPLSLEEMRYDFQIIAEHDDVLEIVVAATPKKIGDDYLKTLELAGLKVATLETEAQSIARAVFPDPKINKKKSFVPTLSLDLGSPLIIADLGLQKSSLIFWDKNAIQFTSSLKIISGKITEEISTKLKLDLNKAIKARDLCGLDPKKGKGEIFKIISGFFDELALEIIHNKNYYEHLSGRSIKDAPLILTGESSILAGVKEYLGEKIGSRVFSGNPLTNLSIKPAEGFLKQAVTFTNAIGLALKYLTEV